MHAARPKNSASNPAMVPPTIAPTDGGCFAGCAVGCELVGTGVGADVGAAIRITSGVGLPVFMGIVVVPWKHAPTTELTKRQAISLLNPNWSTHPEADATIVLGVGFAIVCVVNNPAALVVVTVASLSAWYRYVVAEPSPRVPRGCSGRVTCASSKRPCPNCHSVTAVWTLCS